MKKLEEINKGNNAAKNDVVENEDVTEPVSENSEEKDPEKAEPEATPSNVPLGVIMDKRTQELRNVVFTMMNNYGIPASLMDYILCTILTDVRDLKAKEYTDCIAKEG